MPVSSILGISLTAISIGILLAVSGSDTIDGVYNLDEIYRWIFFGGMFAYVTFCLIKIYFGKTADDEDKCYSNWVGDIHISGI
jgi:hypothetical protein